MAGADDPWEAALDDLDLSDSDSHITWEHESEESGDLRHTACGKQAGKVKKFFKDNGYGFITPDDGSEDIFVHKSGAGEDWSVILLEGTRVQYEVKYDDSKGKRFACSCKGVSPSAQEER